MTGLNDRGQVIGNMGDPRYGFVLDFGPDLAATTLDWRPDGGVSFSWQERQGLFGNTSGTTLAVYWAKGPHFEDRVGNPIYTRPTNGREGTFGPAIPIIRVADIEQAIRVSNGTAYGLSSGVCTDRLDYITRFVDELQVGTVNVWEVPGYRIEMSPFGGIKDSGLGYKEGVVEAMKSFTNVKTYSLPWPA